MNLFRKKPISSIESKGTGLERCLTAFDLIFMGIGGIIGAGVFVISGVVAATHAGPGVTLSYAFAALACVFVALSYAELASSIGGCGGAYGYTYVGVGEIAAFGVAWMLFLQYGLSISTVAAGWSGYITNAFAAANIQLPKELLSGPFEGGIIDLPAVLVVGLLAGLLCLGTQQSARFNTAIVFVKLFAIALFIGIAAFHADPKHWDNFLPFGIDGAMRGAALVFFAYIGFDSVATAAEETIKPQRNLPIGIIGSLVACSILYIIVAALLTLAVPYTQLNVKSPVAEVLLAVSSPTAAAVISAGAIGGLTTVILVNFYSLSRICLAVSRDGLLPKVFAKVSPRTHSPVFVIVWSGVFLALIAGFAPIAALAELVNIGALTAFTIACIGAIVLRISEPNLPRPFKLPLFPLVPALGAGMCIYLMFQLTTDTWIRFGVWLAIGLLIYFAYGHRKSALASTKKEFT
jgi:APA family basic amino acid/polyamine antiporter